MAEKKIKARNEIPVEDTWNLADLFINDEAWESALEALAQDEKKLSGYAGTLANSAETLYEYLYLSEQTDVAVHRLADYAMRKSDEDTREGKYQAMVGRFMSQYTDLMAAMSFETPEILAISQETLDAFYAQYPALERYRRYITDLRRRKDHILSEAEERLLAAADLLRAGVSAQSACTRCGFQDYSTFQRAFRRQFGSTPRDLQN